MQLQQLWQLVQQQQQLQLQLQHSYLGISFSQSLLFVDAKGRDFVPVWDEIN